MCHTLWLLVVSQMVLSRTWYRRAFWTTTVLQVVAAIIDITIVQRWNRRVGVSDKLFYVLGDAIVQEIVLMLDWMPAIVLTSKLCPIGVESTVYALLAGFQNFGQSVSSSLGVLALDLGGIQTPDDALCDFSNLTLLIIIGHIVLPLLTIPLTFWLIPNAKMTDDLVGGLPMMGEAEKDDSDGSDAGSNSSNCNGEAGGGTDATGVEGRGGPLAPAEDMPPLVAPVSVSAPVAADGAAQERDQEPAQGSSGPFRRGRGIRANRFERPLALIADAGVFLCFLSYDLAYEIHAVAAAADCKARPEPL